MTFLAPQTVAGRFKRTPVAAWTGPTATLTNRWTFEDSSVSGTSLSAAVGSITGTLNSTSAITSTAGPSGSLTARNFDGTGYINMSGNALPGGLSAHSCFLWWMPTDSSFANDGVSTTTLLNWYQDGSNGVRFVAEYTSSTTGYNLGPRTDKAGVEKTVVLLNTCATMNVWYHVGYTMDGSSNITMYLNGSLASGYNATPYGGGKGNANTFCGWGSGGAGRFKGKAYNLVVYNSALSGSEVTQLYNAQ